MTSEVLHASFVVEHIVPRGKGIAFRLWHAKLTWSARQCVGFVRADLCSPVKGKDLKWYSIIHFDTPEHLNLWLKSEAREKLLQSGQTIFASYQFKSFSTGLEGWFSSKTKSEQFGLGPPAWKQNIAVVLGLYPIVMLQSMLFHSLGIMESWSPASSMLVNNLITSSILTWGVMPLVTRSLTFWLQPSNQPIPAENNTLGVAVVVLSLIAMLIAFNSWMN
jgi:antibiotic biosynthesis monooxygenase (ABM) superfamily enzyme